MCNFCNLKLESCRVRVHPQRIRQHSVCYTCRNSDWQQRRGIPMIVPWVEKLAFVPKWADQCPTCSIITNFSHGVKPFFQKTENFFISAGGSVVSPAFLCISHNGFDISTWICGNLLPQPECFKEKT
ncbi:MAG TPA: hypothetical protein DC019_04880 [Ruminococcus sp.]|nr:hypothetical protein [Ruminococcus sp.]